MTVILDQFIHTLVESGLMTKEEVRAFIDGLPGEQRPSDSEALAKLLFQRKKLTKFQTQAIYQGKIKGLTVGNYVVLDKIGQGGMGHVYKARHKRMQRVVALKVLPSSMTNTPEAVQRFQREVVAVARLEHPNIVTAHDADEADGVHFLVMQYVKGSDLAHLVRDKGTLSVGKAIDYLIQAGRGLEYAHAQGVIHRDIKPSNLLLDNKGTIKILDMGLARLEQETGPEVSTAAASLTQSGQVMGTIDYMPPEQSFDTHRVDQRADIYSLGCTLFYLLVGRAVFAGDTLAKKIIAHREEPVPSLMTLRPDVPERLDAAFQKMLAKRPEDRHGKMSEVLADLEACRAAVEDGVEETITYKGDASEIDTSGTQHEATVDKPDVDSALDRWLHEELPAGPTHFISQPRKKRQLTQQQIVIGSVVATVCFLFLCLGVILSIRTPEGTLVVTVSEPNAEILVDDGKITLRSPGDDEPVTAEVVEGEHTLIVNKGGFKTHTQQFTIESGGREVFNVTLVPNKGTGLVSSAGTTGVSQKPALSSPSEPGGPSAPPVRVLHGHTSIVYSVAFSPDGKILASVASSDALRLWDPKTGKLVRSVDEAPSGRALAFNSDGSLLAIGGSRDGGACGGVELWNMASGRVQARLKTANVVTTVAFSPDGVRLASGSCDNRSTQDPAISIWNVASGELEQRIEAHETGIRALAFSPDGSVLASAGVKQLGFKIWNVPAGTLRTELGTSNATRSLAFSPDGKWFAAGGATGRKSVQVLEVVNWRHARDLNIPGTFFAAFSPDSSLLAAGCVDNMVRVYDTATGALRTTLSDHSNSVNSVAFSPAGSLLASASDDHTVRLWDVSALMRPQAVDPEHRAAESVRPLRTLQPEGELFPIQSLAFSPDGSLLVASDFYPALRIWDVKSGRLQRTLRSDDEQRGGMCVAFGPNASVLASHDRYGIVRLWDVNTGRVQRTLTEPTDKLGQPVLALSSDGLLLAVGATEGAIHVLDVDSGELRHSLEGHADQTVALAFSKKSPVLFSGGNDGAVKCWDASTGQLKQVIREPSNQWVRSVAVSPDGSTVAVGSNAVELWSVSKGTVRQVFSAVPSAVSVAFSPNTV